LNIQKSPLTAVLIFFATATTPVASFAEDEAANPDFALSPKLHQLLRAEMNELSGGIKSLAHSLAIADWKAIEQTSEKMHGSYIMKQSLTPAQAMELKQTLPHQFKQLDAAFHARAKKLHQAAVAKDAELAAFHYFRLVDGCIGCHAAFATHRFPGFTQHPEERHEH